MDIAEFFFMAFKHTFLNESKMKKVENIWFVKSSFKVLHEL